MPRQPLGESVVDPASECSTSSRALSGRFTLAGGLYTDLESPRNEWSFSCKLRASPHAAERFGPAAHCVTISHSLSPNIAER